VSARMRSIRGKDTKPELLLAAILREAGIPYRTQERVNGVIVDFVIGDHILVFVDSPFWHLRSPDLLDRLSPYWCSRLIRNRARDLRQARFLRRCGHIVVRIWSDDVEATRVTRRIRRVMTVSRRRHGVVG